MSTPLSTYRLQLHAGFTFADAATICPYLANLGVTHVYTSPILQAATGSTHGYDTVDHDRISDDLGGQDGYDVFLAALRANGLGHVLDIVPNHMSTETPANRWWNDVLENGRSSQHAPAFDIDWTPDDASLRDRILVAVLGDQYGHELDKGRLQIEGDNGVFWVRYGEHRFPLDPRTYGSASAAIGNSPDSAADAVHEILEAQNYRLTHWRYALGELNYRRFFDITSLAGLRIEDPDVFAAAHRLPLKLVAAGAVDGLRVDHPDGLLDPEGYFQELARQAGGAWIVAEKILLGDEQLRKWPVAGTTGYDYAALATGLLVDRGAAGCFAAIRSRIEGLDATAEHSFEAVAHEAKREVLNEILASEVGRLVARVRDVCRDHRAHRDHTPAEIRTVVTALLVELDVYRSYVRRGSPTGEADRTIVMVAADRAAARHPVSAELVAFVASMLLLDVPGDPAGEVATRFQQLSAPVSAKGVEDTATYRFVEMLALNDVGGDPGSFGTSVDEFHAHNERIQADWPLSMTALSTHDSKRSEDVRARLAALTWMADAWSATLDELRTRLRVTMPAEKSIEPRGEHFILQTLAGAWPISRERMHAYVLKAAREAKVGTSWVNPVDAYESALRRVVDAIYNDAGSTAILDRLEVLIDPIARDLSITQKALHLMSPGVPDIYQGAELLTDALVDPDNRRPVDFRHRADLFAAIGTDSRPGALGRFAPPLRKLVVTRSLLLLRRELPQAFGADSTYARLHVDGPGSDRIVAFGRGCQAAVQAGVQPGVQALILARIGPPEHCDLTATSVALPDGSWRNRWTDAVNQGRVTIGTSLAQDPIAVLVREGLGD